MGQTQLEVDLPLDSFIGKLVKVQFRNKKGESEGLWLEVTEVEAPGRLLGSLRTKPHYDHGHLKEGSLVIVNKKEVTVVLDGQ